MGYRWPQPSPGSVACGAGMTLPTRTDPLVAPASWEHAEQCLPLSITPPELSARDVMAGGKLCLLPAPSARLMVAGLGGRTLR